MYKHNEKSCRNVTSANYWRHPHQGLSTSAKGEKYSSLGKLQKYDEITLQLSPLRHVLSDGKEFCNFMSPSI